MSFSAAWSSSSVVTPGRILRAMSSSTLVWMAPAAAMASISAGDFLTITSSRLGRWEGPLEALFHPQGADGRRHVASHLVGRLGAVEAVQQTLFLVARRDRLGLVVVGRQPRLDGLRLVVVALDER